MKFSLFDLYPILYLVAPFTGAWIEMFDALGIKYYYEHVAPFTGAWIEMSSGDWSGRCSLRRTLHGCVD